MTLTQHSALRLPQQDLASSKLFDCDAVAVSAWVDNVQLGNPQLAAGQLRNALSDLNRIVLTPPLRFKLLELLRVPALSVVSALTRACLNQPIVLNDDTVLQADLIADLCSLAAAGYILTAVHTIQGAEKLGTINPAKLACEALHRAMSHSGQRLLMNYLLYEPVPINCWAELHQLYSLAERQQLARLPVEDALRDTRSSIVQEYLPPLLLACAKPNQLRQQDINSAYRGFQEWHDYVELQDPALGTGLFAVDMQSDQPPMFAELLLRRSTAQFRFINTQPLIDHLEALKHSRGTQGLRVIELDRETRLDTNLLEHLIKSLGEISQRNFARQPSRNTLSIAAGFSSVHYYVAGERSLEEVVHGRGYQPTAKEMVDANPFISRASTRPDIGPDSDANFDSDPKLDPKSDSKRDSDRSADLELAAGIDVDKSLLTAVEQKRQLKSPVRHMVHSVNTTNTSPGGYCVEWTEPPDGIHIGDLVCVRESAPAKADWTVAVIRWISQVKNAPTLLGLELISPRGTAYAAQIKMPDGEYSKPIRVLLLPEIPLVGQSHTLVVPRMVFKEGQRIRLTRDNEMFLVKLKRQVASTGYFSQMDMDFLRQLDDDIESSRGSKLTTSAFDSIWSEL